MKRAFSLLALGAVLAACGGAISRTDEADAGTTTDAGASSASDAASQVDGGKFCEGTAARMMVNGSEISVMSDKGKAIVLDCCDSAELSIATSTYQSLFNVVWRVAGGGGAVPIDLDDPPSNFSMEIDLGCDPAATSCATASPEARFTEGFSGSIVVTRDTSGETVSYCISVSESKTAPQKEIHSLMIYAPNVASGS